MLQCPPNIDSGSMSFLMTLLKQQLLNALSIMGEERLKRDAAKEDVSPEDMAALAAAEQGNPERSSSPDALHVHSRRLQPSGRASVLC